MARCANYDSFVIIHVMRYISDNLKQFQPRNWFSTWRSFQFLSISGLILFRTGENIYCLRSQIAGIDILFCWIWLHSKFCFFLHFSKLQLLALWGKTSQHPTLKLAIIKMSQSWQSCWICSNPRWANIPMSQYPIIRISEYPNIPISQYPNIPISQYPNIPISQYPTMIVAALYKSWLKMKLDNSV